MKYWYIPIVVFAIELGAVTLFGASFKVPAFTGVIIGVPAIIVGWWRDWRQFVMIAISLTIISLAAEVIGNGSGGGTLLFIAQLIGALWVYAKQQERPRELLAVLFWSLAPLGILVEFPLHNTIFLPPGFRP